MKVELLSYTPEAELLVAAAARSCHSRKSAKDILSKMKPEKARRLIRDLVRKGHTSVLEHAVFTFSIEGISRVCTHQLVRHRIASYSQQSQRHVKLTKSSFIVPPSIKSKPEARKLFDDVVSTCLKAYEKLLDMGIPREDARFLIPQAIETKIVVTMNARSLLNFFELRCCYRSQWEIRQLAWKMLELVKQVAPTIFEKAGPPCISRGVCPEPEFECPLRSKLIEASSR